MYDEGSREAERSTNSENTLTHRVCHFTYLTGHDDESGGERALAKSMVEVSEALWWWMRIAIFRLTDRGFEKKWGWEYTRAGWRTRRCWLWTICTGTPSLFLPLHLITTTKRVSTLIIDYISTFESFQPPVPTANWQILTKCQIHLQQIEYFQKNHGYFIILKIFSKLHTLLLRTDNKLFKTSCIEIITQEESS